MPENTTLPREKPRCGTRVKRGTIRVAGAAPVREGAAPAERPA